MIQHACRGWPLYLVFAFCGAGPKEAAPLNDPLRHYVAACVTEFDQIPPERQARLKALTEFVRQQQGRQLPVRLTFICTHNSRRSHLAQIWAATAAAHFQVEQLETYSGGTEATAFNPRAVAALRRAGFVIDVPPAGKNPKYQVRLESDGPALECFSKRYSAEPNPHQDFCAVMTCSQADESCPTVAGATKRIALPYDDPKLFDGTAEESAKYDERCRQIAREMLFVFHELK